MAKRIQDTKLMAAISDLQDELSGAKLDTADLKFELVDLKTAHAALKDENRELKSQKQKDIDNPLSMTPCGIYFDTHKRPFCTGCYDGPTGRRVHLAYKNADYSSIIYACPVCKTEYRYKEKIGLAKPLDWSRRRNRDEW